MRWGTLFIFLAMAASGSSAQYSGGQGFGDARLQVYNYLPEAVYDLEVGAGFHVAIRFAAGERIESVALGDQAFWEATPSGRGDMLFVKAGQSASPTNMTVVTDIRTYVFGLRTGHGSGPWMIRFSYPVPANQSQAEPELPTEEIGAYRFRGNRDLRPMEMGDDGRRTYIRWALEQAIPAVFADDASGREALVDGHVRDGNFVIDRVYSRLIFRHGRRRVVATRLVSQ